MHVQTIPTPRILVVDLGGAPGAPPYGPKCSKFHAVFRKIWQNHMLAPPSPPPRGLAPPPMGNPGSAPEYQRSPTQQSGFTLVESPHQCQKYQC